MPLDLTGRVIAITGGSSGIGAATARACAAAGMHVSLAARDQSRLDLIAADVKSHGRHSLAESCDVTDPGQVTAWINKTADHLGTLDAVFANAGYGIFASVLDTTDDQMRAIFETNYYGTLNTIRAAAPIMLEKRRGHILICTSSVSEIALPMNGAYCATKAAQDSIAGALRAELADRGVHVSGVHPIGTRTDFFRRAGTAAQVNTHKAFMQDPEQVARAIVRCLRKPVPEVWPHLATRFGMAGCTAFPRAAAWAMRRMARRKR